VKARVLALRTLTAKLVALMARISTLGTCVQAVIRVSTKVPYARRDGACSQKLATIRSGTVAALAQRARPALRAALSTTVLEAAVFLRGSSGCHRVALGRRVVNHAARPNSLRKLSYFCVRALSPLCRLLSRHVSFRSTPER
jgi:hypothetical protein